MCRLLLTFAFVVIGIVHPARAHEVRPGYLELTETSAETFDVTWKVPAMGDLRLGLYLRFPDTTEITREPVGQFARDSYIERWSVRHTGGLAGETIHIDGLRRTLTDVLVRFRRLDGTTVVSRIDPTRPSLVLASTPSVWELASTYIALGVEHILLGIDHLLFVLGLLLIVRTPLMLIKTVTAFTVAHSLTLAAATFGVATVPAAPLNATIALSILLLGPEIVRAWRGGTSLTLRRPWLVAFGFGLLHGFGFASGLQTIGLPRSEVVLGLLWFNVGVELGQLGFVVLALAMARSFRALEMRWPLPVRRMPGYLVGTCGSWWTIERVSLLLIGA